MTTTLTNPNSGMNGWFALPVLLAALAVAAPLFSANGFVALAFALRHAFALICHQRPERSFWMFGASVAVCARCLGIYLGAAVGLLLRTSRRIAVQLLIAAVTLNVLDGLAELTGLHGNWMLARFVLGLLLGASAALLISSSMGSPATRIAEIS